MPDGVVEHVKTHEPPRGAVLTCQLSQPGYLQCSSCETGASTQCCCYCQASLSSTKVCQSISTLLGKQIHLVVYHHSYPFKGVAEFRSCRQRLFRKSFSTRPFHCWPRKSYMHQYFGFKKVSFEPSAVLPFQKLRAECKRQKHTLHCRKLIKVTCVSLR